MEMAHSIGLSNEEVRWDRMVSIMSELFGESV